MFICLNLKSNREIFSKNLTKSQIIVKQIMHTKNFFYVDIIMTTIFHFENIEIFFSKEKHYFIDVSCVFLFTIDILIPNLIFGIEKLYFRIVCKYHIFIDTSFESQKVLKLRKFYSNDKFLYYTVYIDT